MKLLIFTLLFYSQFSLAQSTEQTALPAEGSYQILVNRKDLSSIPVEFTNEELMTIEAERKETEEVTIVVSGYSVLIMSRKSSEEGLKWSLYNVK